MTDASLQDEIAERDRLDTDRLASWMQETVPGFAGPLTGP